MTTTTGRSQGVTLVTGGTGLIGGEVILSLAHRGEPVRAVVRGAAQGEARQRLVSRLEKSDAWRPHLLPLIDIVAGDTTRSLFGLQPADLEGVSRVIHSAANTQFSSQQDEDVWATNVNGARHLMEVTDRLPRGSRVLFISTASVTTSPERTVIDEQMPYGGHANTYSTSKREAETMIGKGGQDITIVRPSIVLSRGLRDRAMARSILWAVPIMSELVDVPVDGDAAVDVVPVDYVARAIVHLALKPSLHQRIYHVSAGQSARTFGELTEAVLRANPHLAPIRLVGRHTKVKGRGTRLLLRPLEAYLPFINAGVRYSTDRYVQETGDALPPCAESYVPDLVGMITVEEAMDEMYQP